MKILCLIPARKGSKRLPNKNRKKLNNIPLYQWTFDIAKEIKEFEHILVTTDDEEIAVEASNQGLLVPWLRPANLSQDETSTAAVCRHAVDWYQNNIQKVDCLVLLQITSPFRRIETVRQGISLHSLKEKNSVVGVSVKRINPDILLRTQKNVFNLKGSLRSQGSKSQESQISTFMKINGSFYLTTPSQLQTDSPFVNASTKPLICSSLIEDIDIDQSEDWELAEVIAKGYRDKIW
jgi:CMP-N,N'-diacetyllegionaminic acid synthase